MILDLVKPLSMMFMMLNLVDVSKTSVIDVNFNLFGFLHLQSKQLKGQLGPPLSNKKCL